MVQTMFSGLSTNIAAEAARSELNQLVEETRNAISDLIGLMRPETENQVLKCQIELPQTIGGQFFYQIEINEEQGKVSGVISTLDYKVEFPLGNFEGITLTGSFIPQFASAHYIILSTDDGTCTLISE